MTESTVYVVDDNPAILKSIGLLIQSVQMNAVTCTTAREFLEVYDPDRPGCLVLDVRMPDMSGLELQEILNARGMEIPIVIVTGHADVPVAVRAVKNGAVDFIEKPFSDQVMLDAIHQALRLDQEKRHHREEANRVRTLLASLSDRETQVLNRVVAGKSNKVIAAEMNLSPKTIEYHRAHMMRKMEVLSVAELVRRVISAEGKKPKN